MTSESSVLITPNGAPVSGFLVVSPEDGAMLSAQFNLISVFPLFGTSSPTPPVHMLRSVSVFGSKAELGYCSSVLPGGIENLQYAVTTRVLVFDSLGADENASETGGVEPVLWVWIPTSCLGLSGLADMLSGIW